MRTNETYLFLNVKKAIVLFFFGLLSMGLFAQMTYRTDMTPIDPVTLLPTGQAWNGQYDVTMVGNVAIQPVWLRYATSTATYLDVVRVVTTEEQLACGEMLSRNNELGGGEGIDQNAGCLLLLAPPESVSGGKVKTALAYADCDDDPTTFQSSAAFVDFGQDMSCTTIQAAYLYWTGTKASTISYAPYPGLPTMASYNGSQGWDVGNTTNYQTVKFKHQNDANYHIISPTDPDLQFREVVMVDPAERYACFANVTKYVKGKTGGLFWVADIKSSTNNTSGIAGWTLIVIYTPPNCPPRVIKFWDGEVNEGSNINFAFSTGQVPASGNSVSYLGFGGLDTEDLAIKLNLNVALAQASSLSFTSFPGGITKTVNPFTDGDQPGYTLKDNDGVWMTDDARDGLISSQITAWDKGTDTNGNQITRLPNTKYTCGFDLHHLKLPAGSMVPNATSATMVLPDEQAGGSTAFFAYMAIQTLQPDLKLDLSTVQTQSAPDGELTYVLTVKNIGTLDSDANAYILDTLDRVIDFVPGSVVYKDKNGNTITPTPSFEITNQGADYDEFLKFYLPEILTNDSVKIEFKVKLKDVSNGIWNFGCNRYVRNRATLVFKGDNNIDLFAGSNSSAGCDGLGAYYSTPVIDAALELQYQQTHRVQATLTEEVNAGTVYIITRVKDFLSQQLINLGFPASDASFYTVYNANGIEVQPSEFFTQDEAIQHYTAEADYGDGCIETYYFEFLVAKVPEITAVTSGTTSDIGANDGSFTIDVSDGAAPYSCTVVNASNQSIVYYKGYSSSAFTNYSFLAEGLAAGTYKIIVGDTGSKTVSTTAIISDPAPLTVSIQSDNQICEGSDLTLRANPGGRTNVNGLDYVWYKSNDNTSWSPLGNTQIITTSPMNTLNYYRVYVCDKGAQASADKVVTALPSPIVDVPLKVDSGCYEYNLLDLKVNEKTGLTEADYTLTFHTGLPSSVNDNRFIIQANNSVLKTTKEIWVRMSNGTCYTTDKVKIYIKNMEECYPIIIPAFFSPDGNGFNDRWQIAGLEEYNNPEILVYDRYGKVVFRGGKEDLLEPNGWDGTYLGNPLPSADYWYQMNFKEIKPKVGYFTLKRKKE